MALDKKQKTFIKKKVKALGSGKKVKSFYNKDCEVDTFANTFASSIFKVKRTPIK